MIAMRNILVIDDDAETRDTMKLYLSGAAVVTLAKSGREALMYVQQQRFDVILLDIEMPIMNGFQTLEQLRNLKECINTPVVMLTGKSDKFSVMNSMAMGVDGYLLKPVEKQALLDAVEEVCSKKKQIEDRKTVLAIDDDMTYLKQINGFLQEYYNVIMINSTKLALDYLTNHVPDVILLDYQMPLYNGVALISIIRQNESYQNIPFIILSGALSKEALLGFYPYEPFACLVKPVDKQVLIDKVREAIVWKQEREDVE